MVHEGFTASTGRTVLVRTDDLSPQERADVSEFFHAVQRLASTRFFAATIGVVTGAVMMLATLIVGVLYGVPDVKAGGFFIVSVVLCSAAGVIAGGVSIDSGVQRRAKFQSEIKAIVRRSERCRIAAEDLRRIDSDYAKLLPQLDAPATAPASS